MASGHARAKYPTKPKINIRLPSDYVRQDNLIGDRQAIHQISF